ncbi:uncharacterized protein [Parasteatoda tepidariorum]|uniref:uncharacterized protein n=1 Tax=Parasteatoda tepidariorum TaxID=114398 RepID=UPI001C71C6C3|nr:uncharacterized protein LOC107437003 [Parasteatoda tepidariorum]
MEEYSEEERKFYHEFSIRSHNRIPLGEDFIYSIFYTFVFAELLEHVEDVEMILKMCRDVEVTFLTLFQNNLPDDMINFSHCCLVRNPRIFITMTQYGVENEYHPDACQMYLKWTRKLLERNGDAYSNRLHNLKVLANPRNFRCCQILYLYVAAQGVENDSSSAAYEAALQVLWSSIPDPFLTIQEFARCFKDVKKQGMPKLVKAWAWYTRHIKDLGISGIRPPPSLKHICKCAVRQKLKECFQLPHGVDELDIPESLKQYLLLEHFAFRKLSKPLTYDQYFRSKKNRTKNLNVKNNAFPVRRVVLLVLHCLFFWICNNSVKVFNYIFTRND